MEGHQELLSGNGLPNDAENAVMVACERHGEAFKRVRGERE